MASAAASAKVVPLPGGMGGGSGSGSGGMGGNRPASRERSRHQSGSATSGSQLPGSFSQNHVAIALTVERIAFNLNQIEHGSKTDKPLGMLRISCNQVNLIARDTL